MVNHSIQSATSQPLGLGQHRSSIAGAAANSDLLPRDLESEQSILAATLIDPSTIPNIVNLLCPEDFYASDHQKIMMAIYGLLIDGAPTDITSVLGRLKDLGCTGNGIGAYLGRLMDFPAAVDIPGAAARIKKAAARRRTTIEVSRLLNEVKEETDLDAIRKKTEKAFSTIKVALDESTTGKPTISDGIIELKDFRHLPIKPRASYLDPWLKEASIILTSSWRGIGKTFLGLGILDAVSDGRDFGPWKCEQPEPCMLLDGEMPPADMLERTDLLNLDRERQKPLFIYSDYHANQLGLPRANLNDETWRGKIAEILVARDIKLWVIDNLASLAPGLDENSRQDWDPINQWLLQLRFAGITTMMLHHTGKGGAQRGTSAREDNIDCSIILKTPPDYTPDEGARFIVTFSKARVATKGLGLIQDMEFRLQLDAGGRLAWTYGIVKHEARRQILMMLDEGISQADIARDLEISKGQVSKVRAKAIRVGWLNEKNKLTQDGFLAVSSGNFGGNSC